jgi:GntR family transcriptional repressor for pyruvate dehydrogenase complex
VGEKLPSFSALSDQFQVSKPTISEAVKVLVHHGIIESRKGVAGGLTVVQNDIPPTIVAAGQKRPPADIRPLLEARRAIEMEVARLAGRRATADDIARLNDSVEGLEASRDHDRVGICDHLFHYALARAAGTEVLAHYLHQVLSQLSALWPPCFLVEDAATVIDVHRRTLQAVSQRSEPDIERVMDEHLAVIERRASDAGGGRLASADPNGPVAADTG